MDPAETERFLRPIDTVECCFPDLVGHVLVGRRMSSTVSWRPPGAVSSMPNASLAWNILGHIEATPYASADTGFPNMYVAPDLSTLRSAPWADRTAFCLMDTYLDRDGAPNPLDTRVDPSTLGEDGWASSASSLGPRANSSSTCAPRTGGRSSEDNRCWSMTRGAEYGDRRSARSVRMLLGGRCARGVQPDGGRVPGNGDQRRPRRPHRYGRQRRRVEVHREDRSPPATACGRRSCRCPSRAKRGAGTISMRVCGPRALK